MEETVEVDGPEGCVSDDSSGESSDVAFERTVLQGRATFTDTACIAVFTTGSSTVSWDLQLALAMHRQSTLFACFALLAESPYRGLTSSMHGCKHGYSVGREQAITHLAVTTSGGYRERRAFELMRILRALVSV
jgi:hypothetical protein